MLPQKPAHISQELWELELPSILGMAHPSISIEETDSEDATPLHATDLTPPAPAPAPAPALASASAHEMSRVEASSPSFVTCNPASSIPEQVVDTSGPIFAIESDTDIDDSGASNELATQVYEAPDIPSDPSELATQVYGPPAVPGGDWSEIWNMDRPARGFITYALSMDDVQLPSAPESTAPVMEWLAHLVCTRRSCTTDDLRHLCQQLPQRTSAKRRRLTTSDGATGRLQRSFSVGSRDILASSKYSFVTSAASSCSAGLSECFGYKGILCLVWVSETRTVSALFADMVSGDDCWSDANLVDCIAYARASKFLVLSQELPCSVPRACRWKPTLFTSSFWLKSNSYWYLAGSTSNKFHAMPLACPGDLIDCTALLVLLLVLVDGLGGADSGALPNTPPEPILPPADAKAMPSTQPEPIESPALADPAASTKPSLKDDRKLPVSVKVEPGTVHTVKAGNGKGSGNPSVAAASPAPTALTDAVPEPGSQATAQKEMDAEDEEIRSREELDKIPPPPPQLSEGAIDRRLRRIVAPRSNGKHKDLFIRKVTKIYREIEEHSFVTDFEFMSEQDMQDANFPPKKIAGIIKYCSCRRTRTTITEKLMEEEMPEDEELPELGDDMTDLMGGEASDDNQEDDDEDERERILKISKCIQKRVNKLTELASRFETLADAAITSIYSTGIVNGFTRENQKTLRKAFEEAKAIESMLLDGRAKTLGNNRRSIAGPKRPTPEPEPKADPKSKAKAKGRAAKRSSAKSADQARYAQIAEMLGEGAEPFIIIDQVSASDAKRCYGRVRDPVSLDAEGIHTDGQRESIANAERDCHRFFSGLGLSIPAKIEKTALETDGSTLLLHYIRLKSWLRYMLRRCPSTLAGGSPGVRWEELSHHPSWSSTMFRSRPWATPPPLSACPYDTNRPEYLYKLDLFHCFKTGIARDVAGSVFLFCRLGVYDDTNDCNQIQSRLERAHQHFRLWAMASKRTPALRYFSKNLFNVKKMSTDYPWSNTKGSDSVLLLEYLRWFTSLLLDTGDHLPQHLQCHRRLLRVLKSTVTHGLEVLHICYSHGLWLPRTCAQSVYLHMMSFLSGYQSLARIALQYGMPAFALKPKWHACHHIAYEVRQCLLTPAPGILNPACMACDQGEDVVGKLSKLAMSVSTRTINARVIQRHFLKKAAVIRRQSNFRRSRGLGA
ncbi:hypothetical protein AK812_SmicGene28217 [Symbiodinium microadriaticum]|uniref:Uncharacterized protein n=1 Tax=Symbiodinium microadriaticum TaxID=2951 RepID=A0A1Q9D4Y6_SYMMI|nr:hypothetical protein AK812_SmicGene28217 [Symbiodinium microadriaticum]